MTLSNSHISALEQRLSEMFWNSSNTARQAAARRLRNDGKIDGKIEADTELLIKAWEEDNTSTEDGFNDDGEISSQEAEAIGVFGFRSEDLGNNQGHVGLLRGLLRNFKGGEKVAINGNYTDDLEAIEKKIKQDILNSSEVPYEIKRQLSDGPRFTKNDIDFLLLQLSAIPESLKNDEFKLENVGANTSGVVLGPDGLMDGFDSYQDPKAEATKAIKSLQQFFGLDQTGEYTTELATEVEKFQKKYGHLEDGVVGIQTESGIEFISNKIKEALQNNKLDELDDYERQIAKNLGLLNDENEIQNDTLGEFNPDLLASRGDNAFTFNSNSSINLTLQDDGNLIAENSTVSRNRDQSVANVIDTDNAVLALNDLTPSQYNQLLADNKFEATRSGKNLVLNIDGKSLTISNFYTKEGTDLNSDIAEKGYGVLRLQAENGVTQELTMLDVINKVKAPIVFDPTKLDTSTTSVYLNNLENGILALPSISNKYEYNQFIGAAASPITKPDSTKNLQLQLDGKTLTVTDLYSDPAGTSLTSNLAEKRLQYIQLGDGTLVRLSDFLNRRTIF